MAELNLLKGSFEGKLGELYGTKQYGKHFAKAIPFSHAPHNEKQKSAFSSFSRLNRFSSGLAKVFFNYMGFSDKNMLKHNVIAKEFKIIIKDKTFRLKNLEEIITPDGSTTTSELNLDYTKNTLSASFSTTEEIDKDNGKAWVCFIISNLGEMLISEVPSEKEITLTYSKPLLPGVGYIAGAFRADKNGKVVNIHGFSTSQILYVLNGYLNIDAFQYKSLWTIENNILSTTDASATVADNNLILTLQE